MVIAGTNRSHSRRVQLFPRVRGVATVAAGGHHRAVQAPGAANQSAAVLVPSPVRPELTWGGLGKHSTSIPDSASRDSRWPRLGDVGRGAEGVVDGAPRGTAGSEKRRHGGSRHPHCQRIY